MSCCRLPPVDKMDDFGEDELPLGRSSPRRQLQGPRPTPLKVHKDSHKIKKPPIPPPQNHHHHHHHNHNHNHNQQQPLIIYTISPKVIHTNPCDFMSLVQRLTGSSTNSTATTTSTSSGTLSPAARFAAIEKTKPQHQYNNPSHDQDSSTTSIHPDGGGGNIAEEEEEDQQVGGHQYHHHTNNSTTASSFPGILSPHPSTLPPISPNFFSPLPDPNSFNFLHDMSPLFNFSNNNKNFIEGTFVPSPTTNFFSSSPTVLTSPTLSFDLFNHFLDF